MYLELPALARGGLPYSPRMTSNGPAPFEVSALGVRIACQPHDEATAVAVRQAWRDAITTADSPPSEADAITVGLDPSCDVHGHDVAEVLHVLSPAITQRAIAANQGHLVMLHAAALAHPVTGATAVLVAPSGTGKTTASQVLGTHFAYLTDETAAITHEGVVLRYRKPLSIIEDGPLKAQYAPSELGLRSTEGECRLAALLVLQRSPEHEGPPEVVRLDTVDAIAALAPETSYLPSLAQPLHRLADVVHRAGGVHRVTYREAATLIPVLDALLGTDG